MSEPMAYASRHTCGRIVAIMVDSPEHQREVSQFVAAEIRHGGLIERISVEDFRASEIPMCDCFSKPKAASAHADVAGASMDSARTPIPLGEVQPAGAGYRWPWFYSAAPTPIHARHDAEDDGYTVVRVAHVLRLSLYRVFVSAGRGV